MPCCVTKSTCSIPSMTTQTPSDKSSLFLWSVLQLCNLLLQVHGSLLKASISYGALARRDTGLGVQWIGEQQHWVSSNLHAGTERHGPVIPEPTPTHLQPLPQQRLQPLQRSCQRCAIPSTHCPACFSTPTEPRCSLSALHALLAPNAGRPANCCTPAASAAPTRRPTASRSPLVPPGPSGTAAGHGHTQPQGG